MESFYEGYLCSEPKKNELESPLEEQESRIEDPGDKLPLT